MAAGAAGIATAVMAVEVLTPLLMLCWLCCSDDHDSEADASGNTFQVLHRRSPALTTQVGQGSAVSLHLPSTSGSGTLIPLSARSHEQLPARPPRRHSSARHHSAPSVIDEVLHRRDWESSARELRGSDESMVITPTTKVPPRALPESTSIYDVTPAISDDVRSQDSVRPCKKHHSNIKSSTLKKDKECENSQNEPKDEDVTENNNVTNFYIGDLHNALKVLSKDLRTTHLEVTEEDPRKSLYKAKDAKQSFNESVRSKGNLRRLEEHKEARYFKEVVDEGDRSGAHHHDVEDRGLVMSRLDSVEPVGYEGAACYLSEAGTLPLAGSRGGGAGGGGGAARGRHASDGDILAQTQRPESGAFSESDLDLDLPAEHEEKPPPYCELYRSRRETAI